MSKRTERAHSLTGMPTIKAAFAAVGNRGPGFDTVRFVAASAVVLHHSLKIEHDIVRDDYLFNLSHGYTQLGLFAVSIFFALSGFLVTPGIAKNGDVIDYLSRRFMRIMPLLAFVVIVTAFVIGPIFSSVGPAEYYSSTQTWLYLKNITTSLSLQLPGVVDYDGGDTINGPMWTLRFEWICYLLIAGASLVTFLRNRWIFLVAWMATIAALLTVYGPISADRVRGPGFMLLFMFSYFGAGSLIFLFSDKLRWNLGLGALASVLWLASLYFGLGYILAPALTAYLVVGIGLIRFPWSGWLERADLSYGIYLTHSVFLMMLMNIYTFQSWVPLFVCAIVLSCLAASFTWNFVEAPAMRHKSLPASVAKAALLRIPVLGPRLAKP